MAEAGCRLVEVGAAHLDVAIPLVALYPSLSAETTTALGRERLDVAPDGVAAPGPWPVVVISHGSGGAALTHRLLGRFLARAGYLVLMPDHPGNTRDDNHLADTPEILVQRPRDVSAVLDWAASEDGFPGRADQRGVAVIGHSLGGYTALALAGGRPSAVVRGATTPAARFSVEADPRVAAIVLLAPAAPWFFPEGSLADVHTPVLLLTGEHDVLVRGHGDLIAARLPTTTVLTRRDVTGAGHFSFLAPFPPARTSPALPPSQDPGSIASRSTNGCIPRWRRSCRSTSAGPDAGVADANDPREHACTGSLRTDL